MLAPSAGFAALRPTDSMSTYPPDKGREPASDKTPGNGAYEQWDDHARVIVVKMKGGEQWLEGMIHDTRDLLKQGQTVRIIEQP
jgi:hypothetical protein